MQLITLSLIWVTVFLAVHTPGVTGLAATAKKRRTVGGGGGGFGTAAAKAKSTDLTPDTSPEVTKLLDFLTAQKADVANVAVGQHATHGRGLYATKNFSKKEGGQLLCKIPSDCALALADPSKEQSEPLSVAQEGANLVEMYLQNSEKRQQFAPYLDTLPTEISDATPDLFSDEELALAEFPRLIRKAQERKQDIEKVAQERGLSLEDLQYATWLVTSRSFPLAMSQDEETMAEFDDRGQVLSKSEKERQWIRILVPLLDLVNHSSNQPNCRMTIIDPHKDNAWFALTSTKPISAGSELRIAYGSSVESSVELLQNYGFVPTANRIDSFMLKKGGDDCLASVGDWSTTLEEDETMLKMATESDDSDETLAKILAFRVQLKKAYSEIED